jgi:hypothetical protein
MNNDMDSGAWDTAALEARVAARRAAEQQVPGVDEVLLAYARWKGRTYEAGVDRDAEKAKLDELLDTMEPERWQELKEMIGEVDDKLLVEVMRYSAGRALEQNQEMVRKIEALDETPAMEERAPAEEPEEERVKKPRRGR